MKEIYLKISSELLEPAFNALTATGFTILCDENGIYSLVPNNRINSSGGILARSLGAAQVFTPLNNPPVFMLDNNKTTGVIGGKFVPDFSFIQNDAFRQLYQEWTEYRKVLKKPFKTKRGFEAQYKKLFKLSGGNFEKAKAIVNYCMDGEWRGFFPVPEYALKLDAEWVAKRQSEPTTSEIEANDWHSEEKKRKAALEKILGGNNGTR